MSVQRSLKHATMTSGHGLLSLGHPHALEICRRHTYHLLQGTSNNTKKTDTNESSERDGNVLNIQQIRHTCSEGNVDNVCQKESRVAQVTT